MAVRRTTYFRTPRPLEERSPILGLGQPAAGPIIPTPAPVPTPQRVQSVPSRTPSPLLGRFQLRLDMLHVQLMSELTPRQRRMGGNIPEPIAVESIQQIGDRFVAGRSEFPPPGVAAEAIYNTIQSVRAAFGADVPRGARTRISLELTSPEAKSSPESALRHETAHHLLAAEGIPRAEHHPIIRRASAPGTDTGADFRLLQMAVLRPEELYRRRMRARLQELRRRNR